MRAATAADVAELAVLEAACFDEAWSRAAIAAVFSLPTGRGWLDDAGSTYLLGTLVLDEFSIDRIATHPDYRRQGRGRALLQDVLTTVRAFGAAKCFLEVRAGNSDAIALYQSEGFTISRRRRHYYRNGDDGLDMALDLATWTPR